MQVAVLLLIVTLSVELIGLIGNDAIGSAIFKLTAPFRSGGSSAGGDAGPLKKEILSLRAELKATSSQDEFAKWAKIRRNLDKKVAQLESIQSTSNASKAAFVSSLNKFIWVLTTVLPFVISSYHRKSAVFYLPPAWFGPASWWMALPSAPTGAVACGIWTMAIKRTVGALKDVVNGLVQREGVVLPEGQEKVPVPVAASRADEKQKKEL